MILQDTFQKHTVEAIEIRPRQLTSANASHDGLASGSPDFRKLRPIDVHAFGFPVGLSFFDNAASQINNSTEYKSPFSLPYERHNPAFGHKRREGHFNLQTTTGALSEGVHPAPVVGDGRWLFVGDWVGGKTIEDPGSRRRSPDTVDHSPPAGIAA